MSGYLQFKHTGVESVDFILQALEDAGDAYHHTSQWCEEAWGDPHNRSHFEIIQEAANNAAAKFLNMQMLLDK